MIDRDANEAASVRLPGPPEFLVTSYMLGAPTGRNLGAPGYSHEFVARLFCPLLERWGAVRPIHGGAAELEAAVRECRRRGMSPVHFSVLPFQDTHLVKDALNVVVPAWEFPDVPDHAFNGNPQNDWPATADRSDLVIVSGPFTERALRRAGATVPIAIVPVPTPDAYFDVPAWTPQSTTRIDAWAYAFAGRRPTFRAAPAEPVGERNLRAGKLAEQGLKYATARLLGSRRQQRLSAWLKDRRHARRGTARRPSLRGLPYPEVDGLELSGVVYTSIFAPDDGRKNWQDMLHAFLLTLGDRADVTLVFKLITKSKQAVDRVIRHYIDRDIDHRCRVVFICDFLPEEQMLRLCAGSTFYLQATKAEGNCLPLMNYLAAGRPGISPRHSSMLDYFDSRSGFVVDSHPEPAAWPHDRQRRLRTTWGRIVWPSLCAQIRDSYSLAVDRPDAYRALAAAARSRMTAWAGRHAVEGRLDAALAGLLGRIQQRHERANPAQHRRAA